MTQNRNVVIVVGGGAAGVIACGFAAKTAEKVYLIEKNKLLGRKLRITGKGRCNVTNAADIEDFFKSVPRNPKFLYSAFYSFTNHDIARLLEKSGVALKTERGGRVFPVSDNAHDVANVLAKFALAENVELVSEKAVSLIVLDNKLVGIKTESGRKIAGKVIIATGGASYPITGSTGDGYVFARSCGHTVTELRPSLIPIITEEKWVRELAGLSLNNVSLTVFDEKGREIFSELGEMLFTHFGISGPLVLSSSAHMRDLGKRKYKISIDLKPALSLEKLDARILRDFGDELNKDLINGLDKLLPKALIPVMVRYAGLDERKKINSVTKEERSHLAQALKSLQLTPHSFRPIDEAIITSGGVSVKEINPSTMESKKIANLYFAGEVIDCDAYTGGYNLQIAWSTGYLAGISAAEKNN